MRESRVYIGTYTSNGGRGIHLYILDPVTGELRLRKTTAGAVNPSFLILAPGGRFLYAVNEVEAYYGKPEGALSAFSVDAADGDLLFLNQQPSSGALPCHLSLDPSGRVLLAANYGSGSVSTYVLEADGRIGACASHVRHQGSGPNAARQEGPHAHCFVSSPAGGKALAVDLGADRILVYDLDGDTGAIKPAAKAFTATPAGSGPRHLAFHPNGKWAYLTHELANLLAAYAWDETGGLTELQAVPALPVPFAGENYPSCAVVDARGRFLYVSNRGHDSISWFRIDPGAGLPVPAGTAPTGGKYPRHFSLDPSGRFLIAANQRSDSLSVFRVDPDDGSLEPTGHGVEEVAAPACVLACMGGTGTP